MEDALNDSKEKLRQKQEELNKLTYNGALQVVEMTPDEATAYASVTREIEQLNKEVEANQDKVNEATGVVKNKSEYGKEKIYIYFSKDFNLKSGNYKTGDKITTYGLIVNCENNGAGSYNSISFIPRFIEK